MVTKLPQTALFSPWWGLWHGSAHLFVGQVDGSAENDPLHHLAAGWRGQRARVAVIAPQRGREQVPQDKWLQDRLLLCVGEVKGQRSEVGLLT